MLVLTRRSEESVVVAGPAGKSGPLKVTVLRVQGGKVILGFEGPPKIVVHRLEVWERLADDAHQTAHADRPGALRQNVCGGSVRHQIQ